MHVPSHQRGGATLAVTLLLLFAVTLAALYAQRRQLDELHAVASRVEASQAYEAAEAGLAWATAMLDEMRTVDPHCRPAAGELGSFRDRHLAITASNGQVRPLTTERAGVQVPRRAACVRAGAAWRCRCAGDDDPRPDAGDPAATPAFVVRFTESAIAGLVQLDAIGCTRLPCAEPGEADAPSVRLDVLLGLLPGLANPPMAALTALGDVDAGTAALGLHNGDAAAGGVAVQAGGTVRAINARWTGAAGAPRALQVERDAGLQAMDGERLFAALFGLDKALWRGRAAVASVACASPCNDALAQALATHRAAYVDGDLELDGSSVVGTAERPVMLVARGAVRLRGPVEIHGLLYGASVSWDDAGAGGLLRGALVSEGGYAGNGAPDLVYDRAVLTSLKAAGSFAQLPGSWRDFR